MKSYVIHECEYTGWVSENPEDIQRHEAEYLGVSIEEAKKYNILKWRLDVRYEIATRTQLWPDWKQWLLSV